MPNPVSATESRKTSISSSTTLTTSTSTASLRRQKREAAQCVMLKKQRVFQFQLSSSVAAPLHTSTPSSTIWFSFLRSSKKSLPSLTPSLQSINLMHRTIHLLKLELSHTSWIDAVRSLVSAGCFVDRRGCNSSSSPPLLTSLPLHLPLPPSTSNKSTNNTKMRSFFEAEAQLSEEDECSSSDSETTITKHESLDLSIDNRSTTTTAIYDNNDATVSWDNSEPNSSNFPLNYILETCLTQCEVSPLDCYPFHSYNSLTNANNANNANNTTNSSSTINTLQLHYKRSLAQKEAEIQKFKKRIYGLTSSLSSLSKEVTILTSESRSYRTKVDKLSNQKDIDDDVIEGLRVEVQRLREEMWAVEGRYEKELTLVKRAMSEDIRRAKHESEQITNDRDVAITNVARLESKLIEVESFLTSGKGRIVSHLESELASTKLRLALVLAERDELEVCSNSGGSGSVSGWKRESSTLKVSPPLSMLEYDNWNSPVKIFDDNMLVGVGDDAENMYLRNSSKVKGKGEKKKNSERAVLGDCGNRL